MIKLVFCERCGHVGYEAFQSGNQCSICEQNAVRPLEYSAEQWFKQMDHAERLEYIDTHIIQDDETAYYKLKKKYEEGQTVNKVKAIVEEVKQEAMPHIPHCPICGSADLKKLSTVGKAAKIGLFGIFGAGSLGKTYKCNNCGVKF